jgi:hypothetical protein
MRHSLILGVLILLILGSELAVARNPSIKSCREHPQLVGNCFNVHGRLSVYNGAPALRIWKIGTKRILGVSEQRFAVDGVLNVPEEIRSQINQDKLLFGDFIVCPFTQSRPNEMQLVCIDKVRNLRVRFR